jgi:hypothetical protein
MARTNTSLQNTLNELMSTESTDAYVTRIWSTCSRMLSINGIKGKDEDDLTYVSNDTTCSLLLPCVLERVQQSRNKMLKVTVSNQQELKVSFGDLYAHFLIEGHTHTTHYVSMSREFPDDYDVDTRLIDVSSRCKNSVRHTKTIVLVAFDFAKKKEKGSSQTGTSDGLKQSNILKKLLERLLIDGINTVVVLTTHDETTTFPSVLEEVNLGVKEVTLFIQPSSNEIYE